MVARRMAWDIEPWARRAIFLPSSLLTGVWNFCVMKLASSSSGMGKNGILQQRETVVGRSNSGWEVRRIK